MRRPLPCRGACKIITAKGQANAHAEQYLCVQVIFFMSTFFFSFCRLHRVTVPSRRVCPTRCTMARLVAFSTSLAVLSVLSLTSAWSECSCHSCGEPYFFPCGLSLYNAVVHASFSMSNTRATCMLSEPGTLSKLALCLPDKSNENC